VEKHDPIKGILPGPGTAVVTFNDPAFESYGLHRNENAPVGRAAAEAYVRALNRLLDPAHPDPRDASKTLPPRRIRLGSDSVAVFWADRGGEAFADLFGELFDRPDPETVGRILEAPRSGRVTATRVGPRFFSLTLSAAQGRAAIRDWFVGAVDEVHARVRQYFRDLELRFPFDNPPAPSLSALLRSVVLGGDASNLHPNLAGEAFRAILRDRPMPTTLLATAVRRIRAEGPLTRGAKGRPDWNRSHLRMQLLKAALERLRRASRPELTEVKAMLDEGSSHGAYRLGRLFAVLERLQGLAQGDVNATIADRFYGSASAMPAVAFPQLLRLSKHHLAKLRRERPGAAVNLEKLIGSICEGFPAQRFPAVLAMEDQGLFAIGYYHQRQALFQKRDQASEPAARPTTA
jgi:CRISPR-associated protein Csd1